VLGTIDLTGSLGFDQSLEYTGTVHFGASPAASAAPPAPQTSSGLLGALSGALSGKSSAASLKSQLLRRFLNLRLRITGTLAQPRLALVP
jgi:surface antigen